MPGLKATFILLRLYRALSRLPQTDESRVHDPLSAGRRLASRATAWQAGAAALVALAFLPFGAPSALAAAVGGGAIVAGSVVAALMALGGGIQPAGTAGHSTENFVAMGHLSRERGREKTVS